MSIELLKNDREWASFLETNQTASFYHGLKWRDVIRETFNLEPLYLLIRDHSGRVVGIYPSFIRNFMNLKVCDSLFFSDYGGPIIEDHFVKTGMFLLRNFLKDFCPRIGVDFVRFNFMEENHFSFFLKNQSTFIGKASGVMEVDLSAVTSDFLWHKVLSAGTRRKIRVVERLGYQLEEAKSRSDLLEFFNLYSQNMRSIGVISDSRQLIENIWRSFFPNDLRIHLLRKDKLVAAEFFFVNNHGSYDRYSAIDRESVGNRLSPSIYLRWMEIKKAEREGKKLVSFGATSSDPYHPHHFQKLKNGACFHLQEKMLCPFSTKGNVFVFMNGKAVPIWQAYKELLPARLREFLNGKLFRVNSF
jgi:hypothetical protein